MADSSLDTSIEDDRKIPATAVSIPTFANLTVGDLSNGAIPSGIPGQVGSNFADDDDDNWSRQVEMDETTTIGYIQDESFRMEAVLEQERRQDNGTSSHAINMNLNQGSVGSSTSRGERHDPSLPPPEKPELTLREKLVLRERQGRIETERARLKRQFALSGASDANNEDTMGDYDTEYDNYTEVHGSQNEVFLESQTTEPAGPPPIPELTMKEKLVLRERERRIETERARLKRQFALSGTSDVNNDDIIDDETEYETYADVHLENEVFPLNAYIDNQSSDVTPIFRREGSTAERTLGEESTKVHPDHESPVLDDAARLGFNMERFLRNNEAFSPLLEQRQEPSDEGVVSNHSDPGVVMERFLSNPIVVPSDAQNDANDMVACSPQDPGVVMERFLNNPIVVPSIAQNQSTLINREHPPHGHPIIDVGGVRVGFEGQRSVSFDVGTSTVENVASFGYDVATSTSIVSSSSIQGELGEIDYETPDDDIPAENILMSPSYDISERIAPDEFRVMRLTEADMKEMAAIEEASIGNAPPSEREEEMLSEIGELVDFGAGHNLVGADNPVVSHETPATTMESASQVSDSIVYPIGAPNAVAPTNSTSSCPDEDSADQQSVEHLPIQAISTQLLLSPGAISNQSVAVNPPSVIAEEDTTEVLLGDVDTESRVSALMPDNGGGSNDITDFSAAGNFDRITVNKSSHLHFYPSFEAGKSSQARKALQLPSTFVGLFSQENQSFPALHPNGYEPPQESQGEASLQLNIGHSGDDSSASALIEHASRKLQIDVPTSSTMNESIISQYGSIENPKDLLVPDGANRNLELGLTEDRPLLSNDLPVTMRSHLRKRRSLRSSSSSQRPSVIGWDDSMHRWSLQHSAVLEYAFKEVQCQNDSDSLDAQNECEIYLKSTMLQRAFPERQLALLVTLLLEIPVLLVVTGEGDALCQLLGRKKYNLLIGLLPLTSAISGNVGLQASTLTTRAISHFQVTQDSYKDWFMAEVGTSVYLGLGMGTTIGLIAYVAGGYDFPFAGTMFLAQLISILTAGITGTLAPIIFSFIFKRDSGKWAGPLETAIQDIVGSFALMVISYKVLLLIGHRDIDPSDVCFA